MEAYKERTGLTCSALSFKDIAEGALPPTPQYISGERVPPDETNPLKIDMVICSFALHLIESPSELFSTLWELSTKSRWLVVLAPHKKPEVSFACTLPYVRN